MGKFYSRDFANSVANDFMVSAAKNGINYDELMQMLNEQGEELLKYIQAGISVTAMEKARIEVVTKQIKVLRKQLGNKHGVDLDLVDRKDLGGRDWAIDMSDGEVRDVFIAKDIKTNGDMKALERVISAITPIFFSGVGKSLHKAKKKAKQKAIDDNATVSTKKYTPKIEEVKAVEVTETKTEVKAEKKEPEKMETVEPEVNPIEEAVKNSVNVVEPKKAEVKETTVTPTESSTEDKKETVAEDEKTTSKPATTQTVITRTRPKVTIIKS